MTVSTDISIIGCGKVGCAIARLAERYGWNISALASRDENRSRELADQIGSPQTATDITRAAGAGGIVLLTVSDDAIESLCNELSDAGAFASGSIVAHCSGALGSDILASARDKCGAKIASMHPLATFPTAEAAIEKFAGTYCFCEGDPAATDELMSLAGDIGGKPRLIKSEGKVLYHAAACMASNYFVTLTEAAMALCDTAGIDRQTAWDALSPLVSATLDNVTKLGPTAALTGPIARGDAETIARHIDALDACDADLQAFYRIAGRLTLQLAMNRNNRDQASDNAIAKTLDSPLKQE
ncbi:MAG: DUF2520 domain-containing protein [Phycisphaerales bacterium]|jgi:predicted short-subunit dehydrogenase-like oxidoreductase (DUF2520 family)|nr:DUF2520 domain-containing protein [Phycisphaerales bacterium]